MIEIVDTHCHLDFEENDNDINEVIHRANKNNVEYLVSISVNLNNFELNKFLNVLPNKVLKKIG